MPRERFEPTIPVLERSKTIAPYTVRCTHFLSFNHPEILGEDKKLWTSLWNFLQFSVTYTQVKEKLSPAKVKGKVFPVLLTEHHAMKVYWGVEVWLHAFFDFGSRWRWVFSFTPQPLYSQEKSPWYPLYRRLGGLHNRSGHGGEGNIS
jgi:hypothetical protein